MQPKFEAGPLAGVAAKGVKSNLNLSKHVILGQEAGSLPIHDLNVGFLGWMDVELVEDHYLFVPSGARPRSDTKGLSLRVKYPRGMIGPDYRTASQCLPARSGREQNRENKG